MGFMDTIISFMAEHTIAITTAGTVVWAGVRKFWPTKNPAGVGHDIRDFMIRIGKIGTKVLEVVSAIEDALLGFLPQRIKKISKK